MENKLRTAYLLADALCVTLSNASPLYGEVYDLRAKLGKELDGHTRALTTVQYLEVIRAIQNAG